MQGPNARRGLLMKAADAILARRDAFVAAMIAETGATAGWALFNLDLAATVVREAAAITTQITGEVIPSDKPGCIALALKEPVGVILGIAPWNGPIVLGVRAIAVPLACGNTVILKASETCPRTHTLIIDAFAEAGFPDGVVNLVTNAPADAAEVVGALIDAPEVKRINFTGSTAVGRIVARRAAEHLKPCLLELGGKAPLIVLEDADLDEAVKAAAFGAFMNQGQVCMSTERIIVVDCVADAFAEQFAAKAASISAGDPREGTAPLGAVVAQRTVSHVNSLIDDATSKGATVIAGGKADSVVMPATVVDGVTATMDLYRDESFGPIVAIIRARDAEHAVALANDSSTASRRPSSHATSSWAWPSRGASNRASAMSTARPSTTSRRCRSAASGPQATAVSAGGRASTASPRRAGLRSRRSPAISRSDAAASVPGLSRTRGRYTDLASPCLTLATGVAVRASGHCVSMDVAVTAKRLRGSEPRSTCLLAKHERTLHADRQARWQVHEEEMRLAQQVRNSEALQAFMSPWLAA
jgi:acyl-CoA reductase-like NAD-dependent aldehyde dehydrogenase